jgi:hypothetical protein
MAVIRPILGALLAVVSTWPTTAWAGTIRAAYGSISQTAVYTPDPIVSRPLGLGTFSLHSASEAGSGSNFVSSYAHYPDQIAPIPEEFFPTGVNTPVTGPFSSRSVIPVRLTPPIPYEPAPIAFNQIFDAIAGKVTSGTTSAASGAFAEFTRTMGPRGQPFVQADTTGTFVTLTRGNRPGRAGALALDPEEFTGVQVGDVFDYTLNFSKNDFSVQVDDKDGFAGSVTEGGANLPGLSPGTLGTDYAGNPLLYRLTIGFDPSFDQPYVTFVGNRGEGEFVVPGTSVPLSDGDIAQRVLNAVQRIPGTNQWELSNDLNLFEYEATLQAPVANLDVSTAHGLIAEAAVTPEPSSLRLLAVGGLCVIGYLRRFWRFRQS